eukprot:86493_1
MEELLLKCQLINKFNINHDIIEQICIFWGDEEEWWCLMQSLYPYNHINEDKWNSTVKKEIKLCSNNDKDIFEFNMAKAKKSAHGFCHSFHPMINHYDRNNLFQDIVCRVIATNRHTKWNTNDELQKLKNKFNQLKQNEVLIFFVHLQNHTLMFGGDQWGYDCHHDSGFIMKQNEFDEYSDESIWATKPIWRYINKKERIYINMICKQKEMEHSKWKPRTMLVLNDIIKLHRNNDNRLYWYSKMEEYSYQKDRKNKLTRLRDCHCIITDNEIDIHKYWRISYLDRKIYKVCKENYYRIGYNNEHCKSFNTFINNNSSRIDTFLSLIEINHDSKSITFSKYKPCGDKIIFKQSDLLFVHTLFGYCWDRTVAKLSMFVVCILCKNKRRYAIQFKNERESKYWIRELKRLIYH